MWIRYAESQLDGITIAIYLLDCTNIEWNFYDTDITKVIFGTVYVY